MVERKRLAIGNAGFLRELNISAEGLANQAEALRREVLAAYLPSRTLVLVDDDASRQAASALAEGKPGVDGGAVAYVCRGQTCSAPVRSADELRALLREGR